MNAGVWLVFYTHMYSFSRAFLIKSQNWNSTFEATYLLPRQINRLRGCIEGANVCEKTYSPVNYIFVYTLKNGPLSKSKF